MPQQEQPIAPVFIHGPGYLAVQREFPGRVQTWTESPDPPPKPTASETPYRSRWYVSEFDTADGNAYAKDEPIPYAEAFRQGLIDEEGKIWDVADVVADPEPFLERDSALVSEVVDSDSQTTGWTLLEGDCKKCYGTGLRVPKFAETHKPDCACPGCKDCSECDGTGKAA